MNGNDLCKIIKLVDIIPSHTATLEEDYLRLEQIALQEKQQQMFQQWLNKKIETMYIYISPEFRDGDFLNKSWVKKDMKFDAFYTGYVCASQIDPILNIMSSCAADGAIRIVDPVLGDHGKLYAGFDKDFPRLMAKLCNGANYILPNLTEAGFLLGREPVLGGYDEKFIEETISELHELGAKNIVLTGVSFEKGMLGTASSDGSKIVYDFNEKLEHFSHGTGDIFASVFSGAVMRGLTMCEAAALAADVICTSIASTPPDHWYGVAFEKAIPQLVDAVRATGK
jgi:pyridoxine kinase